MKLGKASTETIVIEFFLGKMVQIRKCIEGYDLNGHEIVVGIYLDK